MDEIKKPCGQRAINEYISRADLMAFPIRIDHYDKENGSESFVRGIECVLEYAKYLPTADVAPILHAKWIKRKTDALVHWDCSRCGIAFLDDDGLDKLLYCPHCGAKMDGEECS